MITHKSNIAASSTRPLFLTLLSLFLSALVFAVGCSQTEEVTQETQQIENTPLCDSNTDNFEEDWPRIVENQGERASHKALAYAKSSESSCFIWGYSFDYDSRQEAIERAMSECRNLKAKAEKRDHPHSECTLYSVNGERQ